MNLANDTENFKDYGLNKWILKDIEKMGFESPTPIQARCIPLALEGKDLIGLAQTGTGKTAAFGLPIIQRAAHSPDMMALILAPTRELAQQIAAALVQMGASSDVRVAVLVGGIPIKGDYLAIGAWPNVVVATPGRLNDHLRSGTIKLSDIEILAVDEADRMYDMGFMPQVNEIIENLPEKRQTLMFTATMPAEVERLVRRHMQTPVRVQVGHTAPPERAEQKLHHIDEQEKLPLLLKLLDQSRGRVLVFVRTKHKVEKLTRAVAARKHRVARIHGGREQSQRDTAMTGFREGKIRILVATDIAARGIDVADIEHVINYDFPRCPEDYVHRIGRTARVAASGLATSFVTPIDRPCLRQVEKLIDAKLSDLSTPEEASRPRRSQNSRGEAGTRRRPSPQRHGENRRGRRESTNQTKEAPAQRHRASEDRQEAVA